MKRPLRREHHRGVHYRELRWLGSLLWMWWCDNGHDGELPLDANLEEHALIHEAECDLLD